MNCGPRPDVLEVVVVRIEDVSRADVVRDAGSIVWAVSELLVYAVSTSKLYRDFHTAELPLEAVVWVLSQTISSDFAIANVSHSTCQHHGYRQVAQC